MIMIVTGYYYSDGRPRFRSVPQRGPAFELHPRRRRGAPQPAERLRARPPARRTRREAVRATGEEGGAHRGGSVAGASRVSRGGRPGRRAPCDRRGSGPGARGVADRGQYDAGGLSRAGADCRVQAPSPEDRSPPEIKDTRRVEEGLIRNDYDFGFVGGHLVG